VTDKEREVKPPGENNIQLADLEAEGVRGGGMGGLGNQGGFGALTGKLDQMQR
jgi:hypothetical protein